MLLLTLSLVFGLQASQASEALPKEQLDQALCQKEFKQYIHTRQWDGEMFREIVGDSYKEKVFKNYPIEIGQWLEIRFTEKKAPTILELKDEEIIKHSFEKNCKISSYKQPWPWFLEKVFKTSTTKDWRNDDLKKLVSTGKKGFIYFWSPRFNYSVTDMPRVKQMAKDLGYDFTAIVDPRASEEEIKGALDVLKSKNKSIFNRSLASTHDYKRGVSTDIYMRNGFNHFPVIYVYDNYQIHPKWITGVMNKEGLKEMAETFSKELRGGK